MSSDTYAAINGQRCTSVTLTVGNVGPWHADCDLEADPDLSGRVELAIGTLKLSGTIDPRTSDAYGLQRRVRVVGGAGGWGAPVDPKAYANDAGVKARTVAEDVARAVGETIGDFVPRDERVGKAYVRQIGPASRTLEDVLGGVAWWVDYAGVTRAGPRPAVPVAASSYQVLAYDPRDRIVTLGVDDPGAVGIGSVLSERLEAPVTVRSLELRVTAGELRVLAWCGGGESTYGQVTGLLRSIAQRATDRQLYGLYRYRVTRMAGDRVELQAVKRIVGLPDLLPLSMWPGIAGAHAELAPSAEVLVTFIEGDRAQPVVTHFAGKDGTGFVPTRLTLGGVDGANAARLGDAVEVLLPPAVLSGTAMMPGPTPISGVLTFTGVKALGVITAGSAKVRIA
jgi:hypothetical protein